MAINSPVRCSSLRIHEQGGSTPRRLFEILEEKQEPFVLEVYLLERGCSRTKGFKVVDTTIKYLGYKSPAGQFSSIAKSLYSRTNGLLKQMHSSKKTMKKKGTRKDDEDIEQGTCSPDDVSCSTLSKTRSESDTDGDIISSSVNKKATSKLATTKRVMGQRKFAEENKQIGPDLVLRELDFLQAIPVYHVRQNEEAPPTATRKRAQKKVTDDSLLSASLWEMLEQARNENPKKLGNKSFPKYFNSMKALQQSRQLLFDCVRDVVETRNYSKQRSMIRREKGLVGSEEIGKIICTKFQIWGRFSCNRTSTKKLLGMDLVSSADNEWSRFDELRREIVTEIGNSIFEQITYEIVREMINSVS